MPLVIRELIIRAQVVDDADATAAQPPAAEHVREAVLAECVEQVLELLRRREER